MSENSRNVLPLVSVYVPTYNHEKYIGRCLDGILAQECDFPIEVIVIDDASKDSTALIIKEYAAKYPEIIKPVYQSENQYSQRRSHFYYSFLPRALGKYVAYCDGDDYWSFPGKLRAQVDFLEKHPAYSACFHLYDMLNEADGSLSHHLTPFRHSKTCNVSDVLYDMKAQLSTLVCRLDKYRSDDYYHRCRDEFVKIAFTDNLIFAYELSQGKIYGFSGRWSVYRIHSGGVTFSYKRSVEWVSPEVYALKLRALAKIEQYWPQRFKGLTQGYRIHFKMRNYLTGWTINRRKGKLFKALVYMLRAFCVSPVHFLRIYYNTYG